jgi:hypothetical protein
MGDEIVQLVTKVTKRLTSVKLEGRGAIRSKQEISKVADV